MSSRSASEAFGIESRGHDLPGVVGAACFLALHAPLALAMQRMPVIATAHAGVALGVACLLALGPRADRAIAAAAYLVGGEVLWRMCRAPGLPWEFGKYSIALVLLLVLARVVRRPGPVLPILYFLLLVPAGLMIPGSLASEDAREAISFNLSGPFALAVAVLAISRVGLARAQMVRVWLALIAPALGMATIGLVATLGGHVVFGQGSNLASSGGFGPNQVSTVLGLAALGALLAAIVDLRRAGLRLLFLGVGVIVAAQSALTFSRGGLFATGLALAAAAPFLVRDLSRRPGLVLLLSVVGVGAGVVALPRLDRMTGGTLVTRFRDLDDTHRSEIMRDDLRIFLAHPLTGVGPGEARHNRTGRPRMAHTEFTRLLAEHGALGLISALCLLLLGIGAVVRARGSADRALAVALVSWSCLTMLHAAMRIAAPAFAFGLAFAFRPARPRRATPRVLEPPGPELAAAEESGEPAVALLDEA